MNAGISIVVPVFNEEESILPLRDQVVAAMKSTASPYELIFVDDGSSDGTWKQIAEAHRLDQRVRGLRHARNCGQSAGLWTGLQASRYDVIATLDGDLQNDPADLPQMIQQLQTADFVTGVRVRRIDSWVRRVSSKIAGRARQAALKVNIADTGCAMRLFKREVMAAVFPFNGLHRFLPILVAGAGFKVVEFPVSHRARVAGVSKYGIGNRLWRGIYDLVAIRWFQKRRLPRVEIETTDADLQRTGQSERRGGASAIG